MSETATIDDRLWTTNCATQTVTTKQLQEIMIQHDGQVLANGRLRDLGYTKIGPGVYKLFFKPLKDGPCPFCGRKDKGGGDHE